MEKNSTVEKAKQELKKRRSEPTTDLKKTVTEDLIENKYNTLLNGDLADFTVGALDNTGIDFENAPKELNDTLKTESIKYEFKKLIGKVSAVRAHLASDAGYLYDTEYKGQEAYSTLQNHFRDKIKDRLESIRSELLGKLNRHRHELISEVWQELKDKHDELIQGSDKKSRTYQAIYQNIELYRYIEGEKAGYIGTPKPRNKKLYKLCKMQELNESVYEFKDSYFRVDSLVNNTAGLLSIFIEDQELTENIRNTMLDLKTLKVNENWKKVKRETLKFYSSRY